MDLRKLVNSIIISLPTLGRVILFLAFIVLLFGILGIQLFSGALYNRCREYPIKINDNYNNTGIPYYQSIPVSEKFVLLKIILELFNVLKIHIVLIFIILLNYFELGMLTMKSF